MKRKHFIIALMAMLSCFAFTAKAQVAKVGNAEYATIDEAIAAWTNNTTLTLLSDVTLSDVVVLKSTEHHILNLGTYTMTAASGKNAIVIKACGTGDSERTAITIKADDTNPGGINAGSKCVVYYKYADGGISGTDRPIIKIEGGVFTGSTSSWGTAGIYTIGKEARKCATLNISGGTFNCTINGSGKSKLIISGGVFNYSVGSQGDSTANRLISGGKFKTLGFMTADSNNTKFWFGTSMANSNVGLYVDDEGYLCVGGPVITELSPKYKAVASNATKWSSYLAYSSAATNGLYYTNAEAAIKKHGEANVTVYEHAEVVEELDNNAAVKDFTPVLPAEVKTFEVEAIDIEATTEATTKVTFNVEPKNASGQKVSEPSAAITFRLPVPAAWSGKANVYHEGTLLGAYTIKEESGAKYVEVSSANFSEFAVEAIFAAQVGETPYATFAEAAAAATAGSEIKLLANIEGDITVPANVTLNGNGFAISGGILAEGDITFAGVTTAADFDAKVANTAVNIPAGASLQLTGSARLVIGHGATFNITGTIEDAKTADKATLVPSLKIAAGASITGNGVTFNVNNAYIVSNANTTSKNSNANGTLDFNINNSIWEQTGVLAFYVPTSGKDPVVNFELKNSVLTTTSHLVFSVTKGEIVFDNSLVNQGTSRQIENRSTMTIKNGSVVNGAVATSSNAINPGTVIVENATYAVTGEFSGAAEGTGTLVIKKGANVSVGSIKAGANVTVDAEGMAAGDEINFTANLSQFTGTLSVINNDKLEASIVNGKVVLAAKPVAKIGETPYTSLEAAFAAATEGQTITMLDDATPALTSQRAITKAAVIDLGGKTMTLTEDDLYFGTTTFKNGTIVVDPSVKPSTAVFWMFANQTLTFDNVKIVATGVTGTYLIGLEGENSDLNLLNGSEILVENTTALDLDIICVNGTNTCDIKVENSKVNVTNLDGRVFFRGNYTVKDSEVNLAGITKAGFRIEAGQTLSIEGTSKVNIEGEPRDGGIHMTDLSATYTKAETATVNATVNEPKVAKVGDNTYRTLAQAVAAVEDGGTITLIANETFTKNNRYNNGGWWDGLGYSGDKSFTIDLADFTISQDGALNDYLMWFKNDGAKANTITLKNGTLDAGTTAYCAIATASSNAQKITVNLENIKVINNKSNGSTLKIRGGAELNVKAGTEITGKDSYLGIECVASTVNIYDGAKIYMNGTSSYNGCLVGACAAGTVNVYGGYGKGVKGGFIAMTSGGTINVAGGEWIANTDGTVGNNSNLYVLTAQSNKYESGFAGASIINVTGGTLRGGMDAWVLNNLEGEKAELNISGGNFNANPSRYLAENCIATENNGVWTVAKAAAKVGNELYASLEDAFKAATSGCTIDILSDVTVDYNWDARYTGGKFTVPVTINGNDKTIKFTASVNDNNYQAPFRFEADATVKNLTIDMSEVTDNRFRAISSKGNLTVDGCKFIGKDETLNCRAIIFGEGAGANVGNLAISITNSEFVNWKRGITDNENAQDVKTVTITGNKLTDAGVGVSAKETVTFTGNTVSGAYVNIKSYTAGNKLAVTATGNTLEDNTDAAYNVIDAGGVVNAEGFNVVAKGNNFNGYTGTDRIWGEVWGNARESFVIKVLDANGNVMGTSSLNNIDGIIDGDVTVTWSILFNAPTPNPAAYWSMEWTTAPTLNNMPAKVELWVDGTRVSGGDVVLNGPDDLNKINVIVTDAEGKVTSCQTTVANALAAAKDGETVNLLWKEGAAPLAMNGSVFGKNVTIKGTAKVDWSKGFLFVGRGGEGNAIVTFDEANLTSASNSSSTGIHVSGREKDTNNKYDGTLVIKNSTIELDYLINRNAIELDNATLKVKNGFGIAGRPASETESGANATATISLANSSKVVVNNHNGMGLGQAASVLEGFGVMNIDATSAFETPQGFVVTANGTMNIAGKATVAGTLTNNGAIVLTDAAATLTSSECGNVTTSVQNKVVSYIDGKYTLVAAVAKIGDKYFASLAEAIAASTPETGWGGEVTLLKDVTLEGGYADAAEGLRIEKSVTINGGGYTIDCGTFTKGIRIYQNGDKASNVMFKHTNIVNNNYQGRCIDTRSGKINLMLNGGVNLTAHGTNSQPLTIGGSEAMTKVTISGGTIDAGTSGYAVICFVPVTNHINVQGNAVIKGFAAFYLKEGVTNTAIKLAQATSIGTNKYAAASGDFGAIVIEGSNNVVRLEHSEAVVKAVAGDGAEMAAQAAFLLRGNNNTVGYYNNADAQVVTEGGQAYWTLSDADVTGTRYERNGVEMLLEAETCGYQFITVEDALRYAQDGNTVKLLANVDLTSTTTISKAITLDGNNHKLTVSGNGVNALTVSATKDKTVTFKNLEVACTGYGAGSITAGIYNTGKNNLVLDNVNVLSSNYGIFSSTGNIVVNNSTLKGDMYAIYSTVEADIQLNGSTLEKTKNYGAGSAIYVQKSGSKLDIVNSTITAYAPQANIVAAIEIGDNNVEMNIDNNSTITIEGNNVYVVYVGDKMYNSKKITSGNYNIAAGATINKPNAMLPTIFIKDSKVQLVKDNVAPVMSFTLQDAVNDVEEDQTVQLIDNLELSEVVTVASGKNVTLDLNGKTLSTAFNAGSTTNHHYAIHNYGELTITDSSDAKDGKISARGNFNYGKLTLKAGTIEAVDDNGGYAVRNYAGAEFVMDGGAVVTTNENGDAPGSGYDATSLRVDTDAEATINAGTITNVSNFTYAIDNNGTVTVNGGTVTSVHSTVSNYGTTTINGGSFTCNGLEGITAHVIVAWDGSTTTINGGTFDGKDNYNGFNVDAVAGANVEIKGGNFLSVHSGSLYGEGTITVSAGTFFDKIDDARCVVGFQAVANENGTYTVKETGCRNAMTIVDGEETEFVNAKKISVGTLTYQRTIKEANLNKWQPLFVPFEIPVATLTDMGYEVAYFNDFRETFDSNGDVVPGNEVVELVKIKHGILKANYPYVIKATKSEALNMELVLTDATLYQTASEYHHRVECSSATKRFEFMGTYKAGIKEDLVGADGTVYVMSGGGLKSLVNGGTYGAFRLYMTITHKDGSPYIGSNESSARTIRLEVIGEENENGETIIYDVVGTEQKSEAIFDLQGRRVLSPVKGNLYIINGKKVVY